MSYEYKVLTRHETDENSLLAATGQMEHLSMKGWDLASSHAVVDSLTGTICHYFVLKREYDQARKLREQTGIT